MTAPLDPDVERLVPVVKNKWRSRVLGSLKYAVIGLGVLACIGFARTLLFGPPVDVYANSMSSDIMAAAVCHDLDLGLTRDEIALDLAIGTEGKLSLAQAKSVVASHSLNC